MLIFLMVSCGFEKKKKTIYSFQKKKKVWNLVVKIKDIWYFPYIFFQVNIFYR